MAHLIYYYGYILNVPLLSYIHFQLKMSEIAYSSMKIADLKKQLKAKVDFLKVPIFIFLVINTCFFL